MPRKLVQDSYRGWYGWEARFNSVMRMSLESMNNTNAKNKRERFQHSRSQTQLVDDRRKFAEKSRRELYQLRQELFEIRAYGKAYEKYSFYNTEQAKALEGLRMHPEESNFFVTQMMESLENEFLKNSARTKSTKLTKSVEPKKISDAAESMTNDSDAKKTIMKVKKPADDDKKQKNTETSTSTDDAVFLAKKSDKAKPCGKVASSKRKTTKVSVSFADETVVLPLEKSNSKSELTKENKSSDTESKSDSSHDEIQPSLEAEKGNETDVQVPGDRRVMLPLIQLHASPDPDMDSGDTTDPLPPEVLYEPPLLTLPSITSIFIKQKDQASERRLTYQKSLRQKYLGKWSTAITAVRDQIKTESEPVSQQHQRESEGTDPQAVRRRVARGIQARGAKTKQEIRAGIFPAECRNTFTLKRFIDRQAEDILKVWTPEAVRRHKVQQILDKVKFPELVNRRRSTSAIYKDYRRYQRRQGIQPGHGKEGVEETVNEASLRGLRKKYSSCSLPTMSEGLETDPRRYNAYLLRGVQPDRHPALSLRQVLNQS